MKIRNIVIPLLLFASIPYTVAQTINGSLQLKNLKVEKQGDRISVRFVAEIVEDATKSNYKLTLTPVLRKEMNQDKLPPMVIRSRRMQILDERNSTEPLREAYTVRNGGNVTYVQYIPYENWMQGASLYFDGVVTGCCSSRQLEPMLVAENLVNPKVPSPSSSPLAPSAGKQNNVSEKPLEDQAAAETKLVAEFPFMASISNYSGVAEKDLVLTRDKNVIVYYKLNESTLELNYRENGVELEKVIAAINQVRESNQFRLSKVVVIGLASPEGPTHVNQQLAQGRANSLVNYIGSRSHISRSLFDIHNGIVAWGKLREYVAGSNMPDREAVLAIIDHTPVWNATTQVGRLTKLRQLSNGHPYAYMKEHFFPLLRTAGVIKVYFEPVLPDTP